jgi:hypothetical protein
MAKEKITIDKIETETTPDGIPVLRVTLRRGETTYVRGVSAADFLDDEHPEKRRSVERSWRNDIEKVERLKKVKKSDIEKKIKEIKGKEIADE